MAEVLESGQKRVALGRVVSDARAWRWRELGGLVCGTVAAVLVAFVLADLPLFQPHSWLRLVLGAVLILALTVQAGAAAEWIANSVTKERERGGEAVPSLLPAWLLVPSAALLFWAGSMWVLAVAALVAMVFALRLRNVLPGGMGEGGQTATARAQEFVSFYGMPAADTRFLNGFAIALLMQGAVFCVFGGHLLAAAALLACALFLFVWRWTSVQSGVIRRLIGSTTTKHVGPVALVLTLLAMLSWDTLGLHKSGGGRGGGPGGAPRHVVAPVLAAERGGDYVGVVLWPPPLKKTAIVPPRQAGTGPGAKSKPVVIPFDGPYWYYKFPNSGPGRFAHVIHGKKATDVNIASTNWTPLQMEAHQNVGLPIELSCCSAIEVSVQNADHEQGGVAVGLVLTDSTGPLERSLNLGFKTLVSSEVQSDAQDGGPVAETVRFPIPAARRMQRFNAITVLFMPSASHARQGAKVAVQSFTLVP